MKFWLLMTLFISSSAWAQIDSASDSGLEALYDKFEEEGIQREERKARAKESRAKKLERKFSKISDLGTLAPFEDIAVIQRRFLPKTGRFEISGSGAISTNNQFFNNIGVGLRAAYFFTEKYGIELTYLALSSSERDITENLKREQNIQTDSLVEPESYMGASFRWTPVYGKIAWFEKKIIPFDLFFTPGFGLTSTQFGESESSFSIGMGQQFAVTKSSAVRWDVTWNFYSATVRVDGTEQSKSHSDLFLMIGYSYFFPEADYR